MENRDKQRFVTLLTGIADYYSKELAVTTLGLYWEGLRQYDLEAVEKALWAHTQNPDSGQFMPKIADVTKMLQGRTADQAAIAWSKVDGAIRRVGTYADVVFDDALIHRVIVEMGGWIKLGTKEEDEWPFIAKEFENRYRSYRMRGEMPEFPPVLIGMANAHNGKEGMQRLPATLVGDQRLALAVQAAGSTGPIIPMQLAGAIAPVQQPMKRIEK